MDTPNILFLIWDACRYDAAMTHAPNLNRLAESNLWFENAVSPTTWSLPSHAAMFSGQYPSETDVLRSGEQVDSVPLVSELAAKGYRTHGVSANSFFSPSHGFDAPFDEFTYTPLLQYAEGMAASELYDLFETEADTDPRNVRDTVGLGVAAARRVLAHKHPLKSTVNVAAAFAQRLSQTYPQLNAVPHPVFNDYALFAYSPSHNTSIVKAAIERRSDTGRPFSIFANYMDTHRPYFPPEKYQREYLGRTLSYREVERLDKELGDFWMHQTRLATDSIRDEELADLRNLYAGEVRSADDHLGELLSWLERTGELDNTLIVVTADHGENLGEVDEMGRVRMGHESSMSENLLHVPLVVAHPALEARRVRERVNTKDLYGLLTTDLTTFLESGGRDLGSLVPADGIVVVEHSPKGSFDFRARYPDVPEDIATLVQTENAAIAYLDDWKVVLTDQESWAWNDGVVRDVSEAPAQLVRVCERHLAAVSRGAGDELSDDALKHLENLGYL